MKTELLWKPLAVTLMGRGRRAVPARDMARHHPVLAWYHSCSPSPGCTPLP